MQIVEWLFCSQIAVVGQDAESRDKVLQMCPQISHSEQIERD